MKTKKIYEQICDILEELDYNDNLENKKVTINVDRTIFRKIVLKIIKENMFNINRTYLKSIENNERNVNIVFCSYVININVLEISPVGYETNHTINVFTDDYSERDIDIVIDASILRQIRNSKDNNVFTIVGNK